MDLKQALLKVEPLNEDAMKKAQEKLDSLTKPLGSLGKLEAMIKRLAGITGNIAPDIDKRAIVVMSADNGVCEEGVSSCPKEVTSKVTRNFMKGITGINVFTNFTKSDLFVVDIGVDDDLSDCPGIIHKKIRRGTWNLAKGPAMTRQEAIRGIETGIDIVEDLYSKGYKLFGTGEMGIGNTTTSSCISSVLTGKSPSEMTGRGSGLSDSAYKSKVELIENAIRINSPYKDPIDVLAKLGGFDIAGIVGCFIGAAACKTPCLIDGFISATAALVAVEICPQVKDYIFASHVSKEPGTRSVLEALGMDEMMDLEMRLGEGTGAALAFMFFDAAAAMYYNMGTFGDASIEQYEPQVD